MLRRRFGWDFREGHHLCRRATNPHVFPLQTTLYTCRDTAEDLHEVQEPQSRKHCLQHQYVLCMSSRCWLDGLGQLGIMRQKWKSREQSNPGISVTLANKLRVCLFSSFEMRAVTTEDPAGDTSSHTGLVKSQLLPLRKSPVTGATLS